MAAYLQMPEDPTETAEWEKLKALEEKPKDTDQEEEDPDETKEWERQKQQDGEGEHSQPPS